MSSREDLEPNANGWRRVSYTCKAGFVDWGHALPDGAAALRRDLELGQSVPRYQQFDITLNHHPAFVIRYEQSMGKFGLTSSAGGHFIVRRNLLKPQLEAVGLAIFRRVSLAFEEKQDSFPFNLATDSGFSSEDLMSNTIGFISAFRDIPQSQMRSMLGELTVDQSREVWDANLPDGLGGIKNRRFAPLRYQTPHCPAAPALPEVFSTLRPARPGENWVAPLTGYLPPLGDHARFAFDFDDKGILSWSRKRP